MKEPERQIVVIPGIQMGKLKICRNIGVFGRFFALQIGHAAFLAQRIESDTTRRLGFITTAYHIHSLLCHFRREVIKHDTVYSAEIKNLLQFVEAADFYFYFQVFTFFLAIFFGTSDCFVDTSGARCDIEAETQGQGQAIAENLTAMIVIHDLNLALRFCDRFLLLREGEVYRYGGAEIFDADALRDVYGVKGSIVQVQGQSLVLIEDEEKEKLS